MPKAPGIQSVQRPQIDENLLAMAEAEQVQAAMKGKSQIPDYNYTLDEFSGASRALGGGPKTYEQLARGSGYKAPVDEPTPSRKAPLR